MTYWQAAPGTPTVTVGVTGAVTPPAVTVTVGGEPLNVGLRHGPRPLPARVGPGPPAAGVRATQAGGGPLSPTQPGQAGGLPGPGPDCGSRGPPAGHDSHQTVTESRSPCQWHRSRPVTRDQPTASASVSGQMTRMPAPPQVSGGRAKGTRIDSGRDSTVTDAGGTVTPLRVPA